MDVAVRDPRMAMRGPSPGCPVKVELDERSERPTGHTAGVSTSQNAADHPDHDPARHEEPEPEAGDDPHPLPVDAEGEHHAATRMSFNVLTSESSLLVVKRSSFTSAFKVFSRSCFLINSA